MGLGPQSNTDPNNLTDSIKEESIDELTKKLEEVALQRSLRHDESRPSSGRHRLEDSLDTPIDLTKNDDDPQGMLVYVNFSIL